MTTPVQTSAEFLRTRATQSGNLADGQEAEAERLETEAVDLRASAARYRAEQIEFERGAVALEAPRPPDRAPPIINPDGGFTHRDTF